MFKPVKYITYIGLAQKVSMNTPASWKELWSWQSSSFCTAKKSSLEGCWYPRVTQAGMLRFLCFPVYDPIRQHSFSLAVSKAHGIKPKPNRNPFSLHPLTLFSTSNVTQCHRYNSRNDFGCKRCKLLGKRWTTVWNSQKLSLSLLYIAGSHPPVTLFNLDFQRFSLRKH